MSDDNNKQQQQQQQHDGESMLLAFFGGSLFTARDLIGNLYLVEALIKASNGKYRFYVAQNECDQKVTHKLIKDRDTAGLMRSQVAIFNFDGVELDSGTVVEFIQAKTLDIPCVVFRTDIRGGSGEEAIDEKRNKWNLMLSFYPRTKIIYMSAIVDYQAQAYKKVQHLGDTVQNAHDVAQAYSEYMAKILIEAMDEVLETPPLIDREEKRKLKEQCMRLWGIDGPTEETLAL